MLLYTSSNVTERVLFLYFLWFAIEVSAFKYTKNRFSWKQKKIKQKKRQTLTENKKKRNKNEEVMKHFNTKEIKIYKIWKN